MHAAAINGRTYTAATACYHLALKCSAYVRPLRTMRCKAKRRNRFARRRLQSSICSYVTASVCPKDASIRGDCRADTFARKRQRRRRKRMILLPLPSRERERCGKESSGAGNAIFWYCRRRRCKVYRSTRGNAHTTGRGRRRFLRREATTYGSIPLLLPINASREFV